MRAPDWDIRREGRRWSHEEFDQRIYQAPEKIEYYPGNQDPHKSLQPIAAPEGSEINHGIHRNTRKRESESTSPFRLLPGGNSRP